MQSGLFLPMFYGLYVCLSVSAGHNCEPWRNGGTDCSVIWHMDLGGLEEPCVRWRPDCPREGQMSGVISWPLVKYREYPASGHSQSHSVGGSSDVACQCQDYSNLLLSSSSLSHCQSRWCKHSIKSHKHSLSVNQQICPSITHTHARTHARARTRARTHAHLMAIFRDYLGKPVPER